MVGIRSLLAVCNKTNKYGVVMTWNFTQHPDSYEEFVPTNLYLPAIWIPKTCVLNKVFEYLLYLTESEEKKNHSMVHIIIKKQSYGLMHK